MYRVEMEEIRKIDEHINKSSKSEAPFKLTQQTTAIYTSRLASKSRKETKVIPTDCFF